MIIAAQMHDGEIADLALLIHYIAAIDSMLRIRFTTSHPLLFMTRLIDAFAQNSQTCQSFAFTRAKWFRSDFSRNETWLHCFGI